MLKRCSVCASPQLAAIHAQMAAGVSFRKIEKSFSGVSKSALERHANTCAAELLAESRQARRVEAGGALDGELVTLAAETREVLEQARQAKDWGLALRAIARLEQQLSIRARLEGDAGPDVAVNVAVQVNLAESEEWAKLRALILQELDGPSRLALAEALVKGGY